MHVAETEDRSGEMVITRIQPSLFVDKTSIRIAICEKRPDPQCM